MITTPRESNNWKLIPADLYKYSIPTAAVARLHQIINAGVRVQGVIIADDEHRTEPSPAPARPKVSLPSAEKIMSFIGKALLGLICVAGVLAAFWLLTVSLLYLWPIIIVIGLIAGGRGQGMAYDPKLVILVDDGKGGTVWVSLFTWYD